MNSSETLIRILDCASKSDKLRLHTALEMTMDDFLNDLSLFAWLWFLLKADNQISYKSKGIKHKVKLLKTSYQQKGQALQHENGKKNSGLGSDLFLI